jgi:hypothetical protein
MALVTLAVVADKAVTAEVLAEELYFAMEVMMFTGYEDVEHIH